MYSVLRYQSRPDEDVDVEPTDNFSVLLNIFSLLLTGSIFAWK